MARMPTYLGEKEFTVEQVGQLDQTLLHRLPPALRDVQVASQWRLLVAREENALCISPVIQEGNPGTHQVTGHVHHLCHQILKEEEGNEEDEAESTCPDNHNSRVRSYL